MELRLKGRTLELPRPAVIGVINVTPDSYVESSRRNTPDAVVELARRYLVEGADILEIGGESTGPGSADVTVEEETKRVLPAVRAIRTALPDAVISIDTCKAGVARAALEAAADIVNDVTAGSGDAKMFSVLAAAGCPCVLMYAKDHSPRTMIAPVRYDDVIETLRAFLLKRIKAAQDAGIERAKIIVDPGLGHFVSSDASVSYEILVRLRELSGLGPILLSPSRKSFLAGPTNLPVIERLPATVAATCLAAYNGASFIRTHDVAETKRALQSIASFLGEEKRIRREEDKKT